LNPVELLNYEGCELFIMGAAEDLQGMCSGDVHLFVIKKK